MGKDCCDRKARAACAKSFTLWQQATIEFTRRDHSIIAWSRHIHMGVVLCAHSVRGKPRIQRNASGVVATSSFSPGGSTGHNVDTQTPSFRHYPAKYRIVRLNVFPSNMLLIMQCTDSDRL